jgi:THO complex subunit 1
MTSTAPSLSAPFQAIVESVSAEATPSAKYDCLETKLRELILNKCEKTHTNSMDENGCSDLKQAFEDSIQACLHLEKGQGMEGLSKLILVLLEDICESTPLAVLQQFYTETQPLTKISPLWNSAATLQFIKVCNLLVRKLPPKSEWTGKVLLELAHRLPLTDKSSVKPWGSVAGESLELLDEHESESQDDDTFYHTFWSLQQDFANPYQLTSFGSFVAKYQKVLSELEARSSAKEDSISTNSIHFLTSRRLLTAQMGSSSDLVLHVLTQFRIIQAFLATQSPQLATALEPLSKRNQLLLHKLAPQHAGWLDHLMDHSEVLWRNWKKNRCQPPLTMPTRKTRELTTENGIPSPTSRDELDFLKPLSLDSLMQVSQEIKAAVPSLEQLLEQYVEALDPEAGIEEEYSPKRDKLLGWQALRLLSEKHLAVFSSVQSNGDFENLVRRVYQQKGHTIPGEFLPDEEQRDYEDYVEEEQAQMEEENRKEEELERMEEDVKANEGEEGIKGNEENDAEGEPPQHENDQEKAPADEAVPADDYVHPELANQDVINVEVEEDASQEDKMKEEDASQEDKMKEEDASQEDKMNEEDASQEEDIGEDEGATEEINAEPKKEEPVPVQESDRRDTTGKDDKNVSDHGQDHHQLPSGGRRGVQGKLGDDESRGRKRRRSDEQENSDDRRGRGPVPQHPPRSSMEGRGPPRDGRRGGPPGRGPPPENRGPSMGGRGPRGGGGPPPHHAQDGRGEGRGGNWDDRRGGSYDARDRRDVRDERRGGGGGAVRGGGGRGHHAGRRR